MSGRLATVDHRTGQTGLEFLSAMVAAGARPPIAELLDFPLGKVLAHGTSTCLIMAN